MFYDEKQCDGCSEIMHEEDDIVVCPECGTPQHRECYNKNNRCVNEHLHAEGFDWQKANAKISSSEENTIAAQADENAQAQQDDKKPPVTIEILSTEEQIEMAGGSSDFSVPGLRIEPILMDSNGLKPDDEFDGVKVSEALTYTQISAGRYLKKFMRGNGKKFLFSWNWAAFFFSPAWFFYRKIYNIGAIFLALTVAGTLVATPFSNTVLSGYETYTETYEKYQATAQTFYDDENEENEAAMIEAEKEFMAQSKKILPATLAVIAFTFLIPNIAAALIADDAYRKKMREDISIAKSATSDPKILKYSLIRRGGVSMFAGAAVFFAESYLPSIIMSIVSNFI